MSLPFGFVIFWQKAFGAKAAHKMLVKLTPGEVQFIHGSFEATEVCITSHISKKINKFLSIN
jgi:hypothetical protein